MSDDKLLNADEVAHYLRVSTVFARRLLRQGKIQGRKVGKEWRVRVSDLGKYVDGQSRNDMQDNSTGEQDNV